MAAAHNHHNTPANASVAMAATNGSTVLSASLTPQPQQQQPQLIRVLTPAGAVRMPLLMTGVAGGASTHPAVALRPRVISSAVSDGAVRAPRVFLVPNGGRCVRAPVLAPCLRSPTTVAAASASVGTVSAAASNGQSVNVAVPPAIVRSSKLKVLNTPLIPVSAAAVQANATPPNRASHVRLAGTVAQSPTTLGDWPREAPISAAAAAALCQLGGGGGACAGPTRQRVLPTHLAVQRAARTMLPPPLLRQAKTAAPAQEPPAGWHSLLKRPMVHGSSVRRVGSAGGVKVKLSGGGEMQQQPPPHPPSTAKAAVTAAVVRRKKSLLSPAVKAVHRSPAITSPAAAAATMHARRPRVSWDLDLLGDEAAASAMDNGVCGDVAVSSVFPAASGGDGGGGKTQRKHKRKQKLDAFVGGLAMDDDAEHRAVWSTLTLSESGSSGDENDELRRQAGAGTRTLANCSASQHAVTASASAATVATTAKKKKRAVVKNGDAAATAGKPRRKPSAASSADAPAKKRGRPKKPRPAADASCSMSDYWKHKVMSPQQPGEDGTAGGGGGAQLTAELARHVDEAIDFVLSGGGAAAVSADVKLEHDTSRAVTSATTTVSTVSSVSVSALLSSDRTSLTSDACGDNASKAVSTMPATDAEQHVGLTATTAHVHNDDGALLADGGNGSSGGGGGGGMQSFLPHAASTTVNAASDPSTIMCVDVVRRLAVMQPSLSVHLPPPADDVSTNIKSSSTAVAAADATGAAADGDCAMLTAAGGLASECAWTAAHSATSAAAVVVVRLSARFVGRRVLALSDKLCQLGAQYTDDWSTLPQPELAQVSVAAGVGTSYTPSAPLDTVPSARVKRFLDDSEAARAGSSGRQVECDARLANLCVAELRATSAQQHDRYNTTDSHNDDNNKGRTSDSRRRLVFVLDERRDSDEVDALRARLAVDAEALERRRIHTQQDSVASVYPQHAFGESALCGSPDRHSKLLPSETNGVGCEVRFHCRLCDGRFISVSDQMLHQLSAHMLQQPDRVMCVACPLVARRQTQPRQLAEQLVALLRHYLRHLDVETGGQLPAHLDPVMVSGGGGGDRCAGGGDSTCFTCATCPRVFGSGSAFGAHVFECPTLLACVCGVCGARFGDSQQLRVHESEHRRRLDGRYACDLCQCRFGKPEQLAAHRRFHLKPKPLECDRCGKRFASAAMLGMHVKWKHSDGPCRFCGRPFSSATARRVHEEHSHLKHLPYACAECQFRVATPAQMRVHRRLHDGRRPHVCATCGVGFVSRGLLRKHAAQTHAEVDDVPAAVAAATGDCGADGQAAPEKPESSGVTPASGGGDGDDDGAAVDRTSLRQLFDIYRLSFDGAATKVATTSGVAADDGDGGGDGDNVPTDESAPAPAAAAAVTTLTLSDLETDSDADEQQSERDARATHELFQHKDRQTKSVWSCPLCRTYFTKLWGVRAHITLKHPGAANVRPTLHDATHSTAATKKAFLREVKSNVRLARKQERLARRLQERLARYGTTTPRRGRPLKNPLFPSGGGGGGGGGAQGKTASGGRGKTIGTSPAAAAANTSVGTPRPRKTTASPSVSGGVGVDGQLVRKRGRPRKVVLPDGVLIDSLESSTTLDSSSVAASADGGAAAASRLSAVGSTAAGTGVGGVHGCVERRRWRCAVCQRLMDSYDDVVTHTYTEHPGRSLPEFTVVVERVPATASPAVAAAAVSTHGPSLQPAAVGGGGGGGVHPSKQSSTLAHSASPSVVGRMKTAKATGLGSTPSGRGRGRGAAGRAVRRRGVGGGGVHGTRRNTATSAADEAANLYRRQYNRPSSGSRRRAVMSGVTGGRGAKTSRVAAPASTVAAPASTVAGGDGDVKLYCVCQVPYDEGVEMIGCDGENCRHEWFHFDCVNIVSAPTGSWYCNECAAKRSAAL